jgi:hypothetical protein
MVLSLINLSIKTHSTMNPIYPDDDNDNKHFQHVRGIKVECNQLIVCLFCLFFDERKW